MMKRIISLVLAIVISIAFTACGSNGAVQEVAKYKDPNFVQPENYSSSVIISINPKAKLYLDNDLVVVALECLNADATNTYSSTDLVGLEYSKATEYIVNKSIEKGYLSDSKTDVLVVPVKVDENVDINIFSDTMKETVTTVLENSTLETIIVNEIEYNPATTENDAEEEMSAAEIFLSDCTSMRTAIINYMYTEYVSTGNTSFSPSDIGKDYLDSFCGDQITEKYNYSFEIGEKLTVPSMDVSCDDFAGHWDGSSWSVTSK